MSAGSVSQRDTVLRSEIGENNASAQMGLDPRP